MELGKELGIELECEILAYLPYKDLLNYFESNPYNTVDKDCIVFMSSENHYPISETLKEYLKWHRMDKSRILAYAIEINDRDLIEYYISINTIPKSRSIIRATINNDTELVYYILETVEVGDYEIKECLKNSIIRDNVEIYRMVAKPKNNMLSSVIGKNSTKILNYLIDSNFVKDWTYGLSLMIARKEPDDELIAKIIDSQHYDPAKLAKSIIRRDGRERYFEFVVNDLKPRLKYDILIEKLENPIIVGIILVSGTRVTYELLFKALRRNYFNTAKVMLKFISNYNDFKTYLPKILQYAESDPEFYQYILTNYE